MGWFKVAATPLFAGLHTLGVLLIAYAVNNPTFGWAIGGVVGGFLIGFTYTRADNSTR